MTTYLVSWPAITVDDGGAPVTVSQYNIYVDGVLDHSVAGHLLNDNVTVSGTGPKSFTYSATGPGGEGAQSPATVVTVPSGVPASGPAPTVVEN